MRVRVLGSSAGGGFPQWNCRCVCCEAARTGGATPRTDSALAVRGRHGPWFLLNASPDVRRQVNALIPSSANGVRATPFGGVVLTDAELDHSMGLLLLRESTVPLRVYSTLAVRRALSEGFPVIPMLMQYCGVDWMAIEPGCPIRLEGSSLELEAFEVGGGAPRYLQSAFEVPSIALAIQDRGSRQRVVYAPALARLDAAVIARFAASDCVFVDGTFWRDDELLALGAGTRRAGAMGHLPLDGAAGILTTLAEVSARTVLVHVNNTNPILLDDSPERHAVERAGVEVGCDGMELEL